MPGQKPFCEASGTWVTDPSPDTDGRIRSIGALFGNMLRGVDLVAVEAWTFQGPERSHAQTATTIPRVIERILMHSELKRVPAVQVTQQAAKSAVGARDKAGVKRAVSILVDHDRAAKGQHAADAVAVAIAGERAWRKRTMEARR